MNRIKVSVIVTTKNEARHIANCLESIKNQSPGDYDIEIIVVDNASTDNTKEIALRYTSNVFNWGPERSAQRNFGVRKAQGDYILYLDADMIPDKEVISSCVHAVSRDPQIVALYITEVVMGTGYFSRVRRFERSFYDGTPVDGVRFIRRADFLAVGGFDETFSGPEDWDLDNKLSGLGRFGLIRTPIYHNEAAFNLYSYLHKKSYYAASFDSYISKWGRRHPRVRRQFSPFYRYVGVFIENGKWRQLIAAPHLATGMYFLRFLVGITFILRGNL
jgi:glycosyltransferase involved in cell wall biosynthesis